jgi:hypothetical protein
MDGKGGWLMVAFFGSDTDHRIISTTDLSPRCRDLCVQSIDRYHCSYGQQNQSTLLPAPPSSGLNVLRHHNTKMSLTKLLSRKLSIKKMSMTLSDTRQGSENGIGRSLS